MCEELPVKIVLLTVYDILRGKICVLYLSNMRFLWDKFELWVFIKNRWKKIPEKNVCLKILSRQSNQADAIIPDDAKPTWLPMSKTTQSVESEKNQSEHLQ